jgi:hypothetical protein
VSKAWYTWLYILLSKAALQLVQSTCKRSWQGEESSTGCGEASQARAHAKSNDRIQPMTSSMSLSARLVDLEPKSWPWFILHHHCWVSMILECSSYIWGPTLNPTLASRYLMSKRGLHSRILWPVSTITHKFIIALEVFEKILVKTHISTFIW